MYIPGDYPPFAPNAFSLAATRREGGANAVWGDAVKRGIQHGRGDVLMSLDWDLLPGNDLTEEELKQVCMCVCVCVFM